MSENARIIDELSLAWLEAAERGTELPIEELCQNHPGLTEGVRREIDTFKPFLDVLNELTTPPFVLPATVAGNKFQLVAPIGSGHFGSVGRYLNTSAEKEVGIKFVTRRSPHDRRAFKQEIHALKRLEHPNLASLYDAGVEFCDGVPVDYLVLEFVDGLTLDAYLAESCLSIRERVLLFQQLAEAVRYAHSQRVVHRDLKPSNIRVTDNGSAKVLDFGIAKFSDAAHVDFGNTYGTHGYMSAEQRAGDRDVDERTDIYSLGVIAFEMFDGAGSMSLGRRDKIDSDLDAVIEKCLAEHRGDRYQSVQELLRDLDAVIEYRPISVRKTSLRRQLILWAKRAPGQVAGAIFSIVYIGIAIAIMFRSIALDRRVNIAEDANRSNVEAKTRRDFNEGLFAIEEHATADKPTVLSRLYREEVFPTEMREFAWGLIHCRVSDYRFLGHTEFRPTVITFHPTELYAYVGFENGQIAYIDLNRRSFRWYYNTGSNSSVRTLAVDEQQLAAATGDGKLHFFDSRRCAVAIGAIDDFGDVEHIESTGTRDYVVVNREGTVFVVEDNAVVRRHRIEPDSRHHAVSGNAESIAYSKQNTGVFVASLKSGETIKLESPVGETLDLGWMSRARRLVRVTRSGAAEVWSADSGKYIDRIEFAAKVRKMAIASRSNETIGIGGGYAYVRRSGDLTPEIKLRDPLPMLHGCNVSPRGEFFGAVCRKILNGVWIENLGSNTPDYQRKVGTTLSAFDLGPKEQTIVACSDTGLVNFLNLETQNKEHERFFEKQINHIAIDGSGEFAAVASGAKIAIYSTRSRRLLTSITAGEQLRGLAFSNKLLFVATKKGIVYSMDPNGNRLKLLLDIGRPANGVACHGTQLAISTLRYPSIVFYDVRSKKQRQLVLAERPSQSAVCFSPDGKTVFIGGQHGGLSAIDIEKLILNFNKQIVSCSIKEVDISPDGRTLAVGDQFGTIFLLDPTTGDVRVSIDAHEKEIRGLRFSPDGMTLYSAAMDGYVKGWKASFP